MDALDVQELARAAIEAQLNEQWDVFTMQCLAELHARHALNNLNNKSGVNPPSNADRAL